MMKEEHHDKISHIDIKSIKKEVKAGKHSRTTPTKGSNCSLKGKEYETRVHDIVKACKFKGNDFNTQHVSELGGCSSANDLECNMLSEKDVSIEIKKCKTPDWMQCSLQYDFGLQRWIGSSKNKIPDESKKIFEESLLGIELFNGKLPPFMMYKMSYSEWVEIKRTNKDFADAYFDCPDDTISRLYKEKGCSYIQVSNKGLYHLGDDICEFKVPKFQCKQQFRVRTKVHSTKTKHNFCSISVVIACQPKNIKQLGCSSYSLDDIEKLPKQLTFHE
jgi:hypothetical protein